MKTNELLAVGIRISGLVLLVIGLKSIGTHYQTFSMLNYNENLDTSILAYIAVIELLTIFLLGILFIKFPLTVANKLLPSGKSTSINFSDNATGFMSVCFCVLGIYILSWAIPDLVDNAMWFWYFSDEGYRQSPSHSQAVIATVVTIVEIAIGTFLCLRAREFSKLLWRLRGAS